MVVTFPDLAPDPFLVLLHGRLHDQIRVAHVCGERKTGETRIGAQLYRSQPRRQLRLRFESAVARIDGGCEA